jgi:alpha-beta hydrolase superfamily lysophospholipase
MALELLSRFPAQRSSRAPLLFVHGAWHGAWCWEKHFLPYFARRGRAAHALSLRAHGNNDRQGLRFKRIDDYVADVAHVAAHFDRVPVLIGHAMGGLVVQRYLEGVSAPAAILLASVPPRGVLGATLRLAARHPLLCLAANATWDLYPLIRTPELAREIFLGEKAEIDEATRLWKRMQGESYLAFVDMLVLRRPRPRTVRRGGTPFLVLGGTADTVFTEAEVRRTAEAYGVEAEMFPGMAHDMMLDPGWRAVADRILAWLDGQGV